MNSQRGMVAATVGLALLAAVTTSAASVLAAEDACSLNTIRGTYAWEMKGRTFGGGLSSETLPGGIPMLQGTVFPVYMTGEMTVGSDGNARGTYSGLFGLLPLGYSAPVPWTATFTVRPDCSVVMQAPNAFGGTNTDVIVVLDNGREVRTLGLDGAPLAWQFRMVRIARADEGAPMCGPETARGRYLMECDGFEVESPGSPASFRGRVASLPVGRGRGRHRDRPAVRAASPTGGDGGDGDGEDRPRLHREDDDADRRVAGDDDPGKERLLRQRQGGLRWTDPRPGRRYAGARCVRRLRVPHDAARTVAASVSSGGGPARGRRRPAPVSFRNPRRPLGIALKARQQRPAHLVFQPPVRARTRATLEVFSGARSLAPREGEEPDHEMRSALGQARRARASVLGRSVSGPVLEDGSIRLPGRQSAGPFPGVGRNLAPLAGE